jgi:hypothetical protein
LNRFGLVAVTVAVMYWPSPVTAQADCAPAPQQQITSSAAHTDAYWYGRFGYGTLAEGGRYDGLLLGFGRRIERNALGFDLRLIDARSARLGSDTYGQSFSLLAGKALYLIRPNDRTTAYAGAGAGWGWSSYAEMSAPGEWHGHGIEGEVTVGYLLVRAKTSTRVFIESGVTLPAYRVSRTNWFQGGAVEQRRTYPWTLAAGIGW